VKSSNAVAYLYPSHLSIVNYQLKDYPFNLCQTFRQLVAYLFDFFKICKISVA